MAAAASGLSDEQVRFFHDEGYLIVENVFRASDLEDLRGALHSAVSQKATELKTSGKLLDVHDNEPFERRLARIYADDPENGEEILKYLEGERGGGFHSRSIFNIITHQRLLSLVSSLIGPEIVASSAYRVRPKIQGSNRGDVPWHQDSGYFAAHCDNHLILTCWIPLVDATQENGCMEIIPRSHLTGILEHHSGGNQGLLIIENNDLPGNTPERITASCPAGSVVFMTNLTAHRSTPNTSDVTRWSIDLRYQSLTHPTNANLRPDLSSDDWDENVRIACYPPEADFVVRSIANPDLVVDFESFSERRAAFEPLGIPPSREWSPRQAH